MKQILLLLLFPCFAMAQYTGNANQKITLGEQTTADGLVYRGVENDTSLITPLSDTSAYIILDTVNNKFYNYNRTTNVWSLAGGGVSVTSFSAGTTGLTPNTATTGAVTLGGTLAVANGGTNNTSYISGAMPFSNGSTLTSDTSKIFFDNTNNRFSVGTNNPLEAFHLRRNLNGASAMRFDNLSTGNAASSRVQTLNNVESLGQLVTFGSGFGFPIFGSVAANFSALVTSGNNSNGLIIGAITEDPIIFGTNNTERMRIASDGNVGIGQITPTFKLDVSGTARVTGAATFSSSVTAVGLSSTTSAAGNLNSLIRNTVTSASATTGYGLAIESEASAATSYALTVRNLDASQTYFHVATETGRVGNVGIGTTSPAVQLHTTSGVRFAGLASITDLRTDADGDLFNGSDFNLKNSIDSINFGLSDVLKLKPVSFNWNDEARNINEYKSMGFIAQDVMNVIPNAASTMGDGDMQVDYNAIVATLTKAIQEQQALIKALEQRILILENK